MKCPSCGAEFDAPVALRQPLTPAMRRALEVITERIGATEYAPTLPELAVALGYSSVSSAHQVVQQLVERGWVARIPKMARGLSLIP